VSYEELCQKLGIDRAAISKAAEEPKNPSIRKGKGLWRVPMGERVLAPDRKDEDMSHLVTPQNRRIANKLKARKKKK